MKKQILAVAVAGAFALPAFAAADSSVTLFGQLQTQIVHHSGGSSDFDSGVRVHDAGGAGWIADGNGPNRIGVNVNHDLGNGLNAIMKWEEDVQTGSGGITAGSRDLYVGLSGDFGRVLLGRQSLPYNTAGKDPLNGTFMQARGNGARLGTGGGIGGLGNGSYLDRVVSYGNSFGIVSLNVAVATDNGDVAGNTDSGEQAYSARLNFDLNPVELYIAHTNGDDFLAQDTDFRASKIGVDWSTGPFRVVAEVEDYKWETDDGFTVRDATGGFVSGVYTMGRNDFVLSLGHTRSSADAGDGNTDFAALGIKHNFSNRVMAFAGVSYTSHDDDVPFGRPGDAGGIGGNSYTGVGGGMRVSF
ncbi:MULTISPECIES: porin [unclassified Thioalkalivibrio]|uniref:porin n=1 Tax=unclassified Thioalkalivibrio TaxID=2621013 RepID=UPI00037921D2|nr:MULTISPECIES: porin [unclassified Thioalkalivibrio]